MEIYFDHSSTTYVRPEVTRAMSKYLEDEFGNPGSFHYKGLKAKLALGAAREKIAKIIGCDPSEIIFTGGGTESCNLAIKGLTKSKKKGHIITSSIEHHAVTDTCDYLERHEGFDVTYVGVDKDGIVDVEQVRKAIREDTILISIMYANNEIGTIQPIKEISEIAKDKGIVFHTDACQASGSLDIDVRNIEPTYRWANNEPIVTIEQSINSREDKNKFYSGNFSKLILRLTHLCETINMVFEFTGNLELLTIIDGYYEKLMRDQVNNASIYVDF